jgi:hypothetical protein
MNLRATNPEEGSGKKGSASVAAGVSPAVEGGVPPPGMPSSWSVSRSVSNRVLPMNRTAAPPWNPNGIPSQSPGLDRAAGLPRVRVSENSQPQRGCGGRVQPRWGWSKYPTQPGVARASQPRALGRNPVGIGTRRCSRPGSWSVGRSISNTGSPSLPNTPQSKRKRDFHLQSKFIRVITSPYH